MKAEQSALTCLTLTRHHVTIFLIFLLLLILMVFSPKGSKVRVSPHMRGTKKADRYSARSSELNKVQLVKMHNATKYKMSTPHLPTHEQMPTPHLPTHEQNHSNGNNPVPILFKPNNWTKLRIGPQADDNLFIYSAYYETRLDKPAVKVFGYKRNLHSPRDFGCQFTDAQNSSFYSPGRITYPNRYRQGGDKFWTCVLICDISTSGYPLMVSIHSKETGEYSAYLRIQHVPPNKLRTKYNFTVCVQPFGGFGKPEVHIKQFIEFIEESVFFGASRIVLYGQSVFPNPAFLRLMNYYVKEGILEIHNYTLPAGPFPIMGQTLALMDCFYRHMWDSQYVVTYDIDEIIVPLKQENWSKLVSYLESQPVRAKCNSFGDINVQNVFFKISPCVSQTDPLGTLGDRINCTLRDGYTFPHHVRAKYFANPRTVLYPGVHEILMDGPAQVIKKECAHIRAKKEEVLLFHYRQAFENKATPVTENRMLHFREAIMKRLESKRKIFQNLLDSKP